MVTTGRQLCVFKVEQSNSTEEIYWNNYESVINLAQELSKACDVIWILQTQKPLCACISGRKILC